MLNHKKQTYILAGLMIVVMLVAAYARFFKLDQVIFILNRDEAALAYNAFLLKKAGVDEWGVRWPLVLQSFGDCKLIGYPMLLVGLFHVLPYADWVVRLPSAIAGTLLVVLSYFFALKIFHFKKLESLFFTLLVATSPFAIFYSRFAYEANVALFYLILSLFLFWLPTKDFKKRLVFDVLASIIYLFAIFTYNTPFLLLPFILIFILFVRDLSKPRQWLSGAAGLVSVFLVGLWQLWPVLTGKNEITIFSDPETFFAFARFRQSLPATLEPIIGNRYVYDLYLIFRNFFLSFNPNFVSLSPYHPWHAVPGTGQLYLSVYLLALLGIVVAFLSLIRQVQLISKKNKFKGFFVWLKQVLIKPADKKFLWFHLLVISLAPASITTDAPHATRSLLFFWVLLVFATFFTGKVAYFLIRRSKRTLVFWWYLGVTVLVAVEFFNYLPKLFVNYHQESESVYQATGFQSGLAELESRYKDQKVAVVDLEGYQYILLAWYLKLDPETYLTTNVRQLPDSVGLRYGEKVKNYHFIVKPSDRSQKEKVLFYWDKDSWKIDD